MITERDDVDIMADWIAAHPRFPQAVRYYVGAMAEAPWRHTPTLVNKIMAQGPRIRLILYLLWLHWDADPADADGGATLSRLMDICARRGETGRGAVQVILGLLRLGHYIEVVQGGTDRRLKIYRPSPILADMVRDMFLRSFGAFDIVFDLGWAEQARHDEAFFRHLYIVAGRPIVAGHGMVTERVPCVHEITTMDGAFTVLLHILRAHLDGLPLPSTLAIHRATMIPRTQVWKCLQRAAAFGLTRLDEHGRVADARSLAEIMARYVAIELAYYAVTVGLPDGAAGAPRGPGRHQPCSDPARSSSAISGASSAA